ncbi:MAG: hypothetical protein Q9213_003651 [Squamulea squamosa]
MSRTKHKGRKDGKMKGKNAPDCLQTQHIISQENNPVLNTPSAGDSTITTSLARTNVPPSNHANTAYLDGKREGTGLDQMKSRQMHDKVTPDFLIHNSKVCFTVPQMIQQHADTNRRAFKRWYYTEYAKSPQATKDMERLLLRYVGHHPVNRAEFCDDTLAVLEAWDTVPLIPGSKQYADARTRLIRDIIYEKISAQQEAEGKTPTRKWPAPMSLSQIYRSMSQDPALVALNLIKGDISAAYVWIYQTEEGKIAKYQAYRQPFSYPVLASDGVTTLPPKSSQDNSHLTTEPGGFKLLEATFLPDPAKELTVAHSSFRGYGHPQNTASPLVLPTAEESAPLPAHGEPATVGINLSNEMTLDQLIEEASSKQAMEVVGYAEALRRGLLWPKTTRME